MPELPGGGTDAQAKDVCLRLLTDRARSRFELADRLAAKGFSIAVATRALDRLTEVGLIDDAAFAQQWVYSRHTYGGRGRKVLAEELRRKGIDPAHAEPALEAITDEAEHARAVDLVRKKLRTLSPDMDRDKATNRLVSMLARKGYNPGTAYNVVTAELADSGLVRIPKQPKTPKSSTATPAPGDPQSPEHSAEVPADTPPARSLHQGIDPAVAEPALEAITSEAEHARAADLVRKKLRTLASDMDRDKATNRLVSMLARKGYTPGTAYSVVVAELADSGLVRIPKQPRTPPAPGLSRTAKQTPSRPDQTPDDDSDPDTGGSPADDHESAADLIRSKIRTLPRNLDRDKATRRLVGLLARRGYSASIAYTVVKEELAASDLF